jgi:hypothetical protein
MRVLTRLLLVCLLLWALPALGAETEVKAYAASGACSLFKLCDGTTGSAVCGGSGNERYIVAKGFGEFTAMIDTSASIGEAPEVTLYNVSPGEGYSANRATINSSNLTKTNPSYSWRGPMGDIHAATSGTNTLGVTLIIKACPAFR